MLYWLWGCQAPGEAAAHIDRFAGGAVTQGSRLVEGRTTGLRADLMAVGVWVIGCLVIALWAVRLSYLSAPGNLSRPEVLARFAHFDFVHFDEIARLGYLPEPGTASTPAPLYAFFPAVPMLFRVGMALGLSSLTTGLLVSAVSGGVACIWLRRIAELYQPGLGLKAVAVFVFAPPAIFLYAPYTESLFLALALGAWYFGQKGNWAAAGLLCAPSCTVRISGAFLLAALLVLWITQYRAGGAGPNLRRPVPRSLLFLALPGAVLAGWMAYLAAITGDLFAYQTAQKYWDRHLEWPWAALQRTIAEYPPMRGPDVMGYAEAIAVGAGVVVTVILIYRRLYGEGVFVGLNVLALGTSAYFVSVPRSALLWWPLWIGIAYLLRRSLLALVLYLMLSLALMLWWANLFLTGRWAG